MRQLINAGEKIMAIGYEAGPDVEDSLGRAEAALFQLHTGQQNSDLTHIRYVLDKYFEVEKATSDDKAARLPRIPSDFTALDNFLGGFARSDLVIIAGRPSMGRRAWLSI